MPIEDAATSPPRTVGGRYRLEEQIGRGGMAAVYRAHDEQLDRTVAVKIMRSELTDDPQFLSRFEAEGRRAASVRHPNVVAVYDVGTDESPYMVMELIPGGDVATALRTEGRFDPVRAAQLAADAAGALQAAHAVGLVHRDVKPGNMLLDSDGRARVADFGIARATGEDGMTRTGATLGSVEYFSPEQARGEQVGPASDVYALGVVLYEMITGRRPFTGDSPYAVATARLAQPAPDPRAIVADVPAELAEITMRAMAPELTRRYSTAGEMRDALVEWLDRARDDTAVSPVAVASAGAVGPRLAPGTAPPTAATPRAAVPTPMPHPRAGAGSDGRRRDRRGGAWLVPAALALAALLIGGYLAGQFLNGDPGTANQPGVAAGSAAGVATTATPSPTPVPTATPTASPTGAPDTPEPASTPPPTTPPPVAASTPTDAVAAFYSAAEDGRFDDAYALWSDRMRDEFPRQGNLDDRFDDTADITFTDLFIADQGATTATVQANFVETYDSGESREFVGYWRLVQVGGRWLLDDPTY